MSTAYTYGGWSEGRHATGAIVSLIGLVGWLSSSALYAVGTGEELTAAHLYLHRGFAQFALPAVDIVEVENNRVPMENLAHVRKIMKPAISDLATALSVSRQSIYNWLNGEQVSLENAQKLQDLAHAADILIQEGVIVNSALLKRKFANGKTLMQVVQAGGSARDAAMLLVQIHKREAAQSERMNSRFANRARILATADFDLPSPNDYV